MNNQIILIIIKFKFTSVRERLRQYPCIISRNNRLIIDPKFWKVKVRILISSTSFVKLIFWEYGYSFCISNVNTSLSGYQNPTSVDNMSRGKVSHQINRCESALGRNKASDSLITCYQNLSILGPAKIIAEITRQLIVSGSIMSHVTRLPIIKKEPHS